MWQYASEMLFSTVNVNVLQYYETGKKFEALILQIFLSVKIKDWEKDKDQFPDFYN